MSDRGLSLAKKREKEIQEKIDDFRRGFVRDAYGPAGPYWPIKNNYQFNPVAIKGFTKTTYAKSAVGEDKDREPDDET